MPLTEIDQHIIDAFVEIIDDVLNSWDDYDVVELDMFAVQKFNASALAQIIELLRRLHELHKALYLFNVQPEVLTVSALGDYMIEETLEGRNDIRVDQHWVKRIQWDAQEELDFIL